MPLSGIDQPPPMSTTERIPKAMADKFAAITALTDAFSAQHLDDPSQTPHCKPSAIYAFFGIAESTGQNKSKEIRNPLKMGPLAPEWTLPSRLADNPMVWMVLVDGLIIDIRRAPVGWQRAAFERGMIPYVPADRDEPRG
jgi:hypothetical protein